MGNEEEQKKDFTFTVTLSDKRITGVYGDMRFKQGVANIVLKHEESITSKGLPSRNLATAEDTDNNVPTRWKNREKLESLRREKCSFCQVFVLQKG